MKGKLKISLVKEIEVDSENYPEGINTLEEMCKYEEKQQNDYLFEMVAEEGKLKVEVIS